MRVSSWRGPECHVQSSPPKAQWRRARDRGGGHCKEVGGAHHVTTVDVRSRDRHSTFQYALGTKSGCESIAHALRGLTESNRRTTVTSIDGVSAYDLISRQAMSEGVKGIARGSALPFVSMFHGQLSSNLWENAVGAHHLAG